MKSTFVFVVMLFFLDSNAVVFNPKNQKKIQYQSIKEIVANPEDKAEVQLKGRITKKLYEEKYLFEDSTGEVVVEIDDKRFPLQEVTENTVLAILGDIKAKSGREPEVEGFLVRVLQNDNLRKSPVKKQKENSVEFMPADDIASAIINRNSSF